MKNNLLLTLMIVLLLSSCGGGKSVVNRFYVLEYPSGLVLAPEEGMSQVDGSLHIEAPVIHQAFATHQIALREDTHEIKYFTFNEWANRPEQSLATILWSYFQDMPVFGQGAVLTGSGQETHALRTHVSRMEVVQHRNDFGARLDVEFLLVDRASGSILSTRKVSREEPLAQRNLNLFAAAISRVVVEELHEFVLDMLKELQTADQTF